MTRTNAVWEEPSSIGDGSLRFATLKNLSESHECVLHNQPIELSSTHQTREPQTRKRTMTRTENLKRLFNVMLEIYTNRKDSHPSVAAQFHVEGFVTDHKRDAYFDSLLEMEIEDCSRSLVIA